MARLPCAVEGSHDRVLQPEDTLLLALACSEEPVPPENSKAFYRALQADDVPSRYLELPSGGHGLNDPRRIADAARSGDSAAIGAWLRYGRYVGAGLGSLCNVLSPDYILVGGGLAEAHELFQPAMQAAIDRHMLKEMPRPDVHFMDDGADTVARGAARHALLVTQHG